MQKGPDDPDLCSPDGRLSSSHYTPRGLFHFKYRQSYNKFILPRRGLLRKGKRGPDHRRRGAALSRICRQARWCGAALAPGSPARRCSSSGLAGVAPLWHRTHWLGANLLAWCCFGIEPTGMVPLCRRARWRGAALAGAVPLRPASGLASPTPGTDKTYPLKTFFGG